MGLDTGRWVRTKLPIPANPGSDSSCR
jgi:hypothetical protein